MCNQFSAFVRLETSKYKSYMGESLIYIMGLSLYALSSVLSYSHM
jgi:hypothetical protein